MTIDAPQAIIYTYDGGIRANRITIVPAKENDSGKVMPAAVIESEGYLSSCIIRNLDDAAICSSSNKLIDSQEHVITITGDGSDDRSRSQVVSCVFDFPTSGSANQPSTRTLPPIAQAKHGGVITFCDKEQCWIALGGSTEGTPIVEQFSHDRRSWLLHHFNPNGPEPVLWIDEVMHASAVSHESYVYIVGGTVQHRITVNRCWRYSLHEHQFQAMSPMRSRRRRFGLCRYGDYLVAVGGGNGTRLFKSVEVFDIQGNKWVESKAQLIKPRERLQATVAGDILIVCGGNDGKKSPLATIEGIHLEDLFNSEKEVTFYEICTLPRPLKVLAAQPLNDWSATIRLSRVSEPRGSIFREIVSMSLYNSKKEPRTNDVQPIANNACSGTLTRDTSSVSTEMPERPNSSRSDTSEATVPRPAVTGTPWITPRELQWTMREHVPPIAEESEAGKVSVGTMVAQKRKKYQFHSRGIQTDNAGIFRSWMALQACCREPIISTSCVTDPLSYFEPSR